MGKVDCDSWGHYSILSRAIAEQLCISTEERQCCIFTVLRTINLIGYFSVGEMNQFKPDYILLNAGLLGRERGKEREKRKKEHVCRERRKGREREIERS